MDTLYEDGIKVILDVQNRFVDHQGTMVRISEIFDPSFAYFFYAPLVFSFDFKCGRRLMWTTVLVEWSNHILKWLLHGERPYWWIHETTFYENKGITPVYLNQFSITCETGPGSPSGHCESVAAVWYIIINRFLKKCTVEGSHWYHYASKIICWTIYVCIISSVAVSRIFISAHFPHQCLFGLALGYLLAISIEKIKSVNMSLQHYYFMTVGMMLSGLFVYCLLKMFGSNPMWSVDRAVKWCEDPKNIHLDSTPLFAMMRYNGYMLGMGFGFNSSSFFYHSQREFEIPKKIICAVLSLSICKLSRYMYFKKEHAELYYLQGFIISGLVAYFVVAHVPSLATKIWSLKGKLD